jgi:formate dehydrogenase assembly factor FdhD
VREDLGRRNTLDNLIGAMMRGQIDPEAGLDATAFVITPTVRGKIASLHLTGFYQP